MARSFAGFSRRRATIPIAITDETVGSKVYLAQDKGFKYLEGKLGGEQTRVVNTFPEVGEDESVFVNVVAGNVEMIVLDEDGGEQRRSTGVIEVTGEQTLVIVGSSEAHEEEEEFWLLPMFVLWPGD